MKVNVYSHNYGDNRISETLKKPVLMSLKNMDIILKKNEAKKIRATILKSLQQQGWSDRVPIEKNSNISITGMNNNIGLCLQLGNMARFYADLLKLELFFEKGNINSAIYILPNKDAATVLGVNMVNFERLTQELDFYRNIIKIPILVIGFSEEIK